MDFNKILRENMKSSFNCNIPEFPNGFLEKFETLPEITIDGLTGDGMTWLETGEVNKDPKAVVIQNGAYVGM